jgi:hypothetical protein
MIALKPPVRILHRPKPDSKPRRMSVRRIMSIGTGLICPDGIILCADSQETSGQYFKSHRPKLVELQLVSPDLKAVVVASGDGSFVDMLIERISEQLDLVNPYIAAVRGAVEDAIRVACGEIWPLYTTQADKPTAQLLIGIRAIDGLTLLDAPVPIVKTADLCAFIGWGCDLARYKAKQLNLSGMPVAVAAPLAAYIMDVVKKNVEFCGGETHLAVITSDGTVEHKSQDFISHAAQGYENTAWALEALIFPALAAFKMPDGKDVLTAIAELGKPDAETQKGMVDAISRYIEAKSQGIPISPSPPLSLEQQVGSANLSWSIALNLMQTAEKNLHDAGCVEDDLHKKIQQRFLMAAQVGQAAGAALKAGDFTGAKVLLGSAVRIMDDSGFADLTTPLIVKTLTTGRDDADKT